MSWWLPYSYPYYSLYGYWNPYILYWYGYPAPVDPLYLMSVLYQWLTIPYYYALLLEMYRSMLSIWRESVKELSRLTKQGEQ